MLPKKKSLKKAIFGPKPWVNLFGKMSIFRLFVVSFQNIAKDIFWPMLPKRKKIEKLLIVRPKPRVNPFGKMCFFRLFEALVLEILERLFFLEYRKKHFPGLHCLKKNYENWPLLDQNHGLTSLEKCQFFDF